MIKGVFTKVFVFARDHKRDLLFLAGLIVLWSVFYGRLLSAQCYLWEDFREQAFPNFVFAVKSLKQLSFPFWTPFEFSGMPFYSDPQTTLFYPPHWILLLFGVLFGPGSLLLTWYVLLHVLVLGIGFYLLSREFELSRSASLFCAAAGMFTGYVSLHIIHTIFVYVIAWFPFAFLFFRRAIRTGNMVTLAVGAIFYGVSTLGGYPQYSLHMFYLFGLYALIEAIYTWKLDKKRTVGILVFFAVFSGFGLAMSVVSYLPALKHMALSLRETMTFEESAGGSLPLSRFVSMIVPGFFGYITGTSQVGSPYWGFPGKSFFFWETNAFIGVTVVLLATQGVLRIRFRREIVYFSIVAALSFLLAMGDNTPLYKLAFHLVPGFSTFRIPGRFTLWLSISLIVLAGFGLDRIGKKLEPRDRKRSMLTVGIAGGVIALGAMLFLAGAFDGASQYLGNPQIRETARKAMQFTLVFDLLVLGIYFLVLYGRFPQLGSIGFSVLVFVELYVFGSSFGCSAVNPETYYKRFTLTSLINELEEDEFRIQSRLYHGPQKGEMLFPRNLGNVLEYPLTEGYNQLMLRRYNDFLYKIDEDVGQQLLSVRYKKEAGQMRLFRAEHVPWNYLSSSVRVLGSEDELISFMNSDRFVPGRTVAILDTPNVEIDSSRCTSEGSVEVLAKKFSYVKMRVNAPCNMLLVRSDVYYPEWKAKVDGESTPLVPANLLFQGLAIPEGEHIVEISYHSERFLAGLVVSLLAFFSCAFLVVGGKFGVARLDQPWAGFATKDQK